MTRKYLCFKKKSNQAGFVFPFLLFLTTIVLLVLTYNVRIYQSTVEMSKYHQQNILYDSLYQMAVVDLNHDLAELAEDPDNNQLTYQYPSGDVLIRLNKKENGTIECIYTIQLSSGKKATRFNMIDSHSS